MLSFKVQYNGTMYFTKHGSLGDKEMDELAECEFKNATAYSKIMTLGGGKLMAAWNAAVDPAKLQNLPSINNPEIEVIDGYLHIKGIHEFAEIIVTSETVVRNGEILWLAEGALDDEDATQITDDTVEDPIENTDTASPDTDAERMVVPEEVSAATVEETTTTEEDTDQSERVEESEVIEMLEEDAEPEVEVVTEEVSEAVESEPASEPEEAPVSVDVGERPFKLGIIPGKNGTSIKVDSSDFSIGLTIKPMSDRKNISLTIGPKIIPVNPDEVVEQAMPEDPRPIFTNAALAARDAAEHDDINSEEEAKPIIVVEPTVEAQHVMEQRRVVDDTTDDAEETEAPVQESQDVSSDDSQQEETQEEIDAAINKGWYDAIASAEVLEGEAEPVVLHEDPVADYDAPESRISTATGTDYPEYLWQIPKMLLGAISSFSVRDIPNEVIDRDYVVNEHWEKGGSWYATDLVSTAERLFFDSQSGEIYKVSYFICKNFLAEEGENISG